MMKSTKESVYSVNDDTCPDEISSISNVNLNPLPSVSHIITDNLLEEESKNQSEPQ